MHVAVGKELDILKVCGDTCNMVLLFINLIIEMFW